jgi:hypothetical protein
MDWGTKQRSSRGIDQYSAKQHIGKQNQSKRSIPTHISQQAGSGEQLNRLQWVMASAYLREMG